MANDKDFIVKNAVEVGGPTKVTLGTFTSGSEGYYLAGASYDSKSFSISSQETASSGISFKTDGTKMYVIGAASDTVFQYSLSTAWDVSTASYDSVSFSVASQETAPQELFIKPDGTKLYVVGSVNDTVYQYSLSTAWDVSTASYDSVSFSVASQDTTPVGLFFKSDGTKMYVSGNVNDGIFQYSLSTAWDVSTASYDSVSLDVSSQVTVPNQSVFSDDGTKVFVADGSIPYSVYQYNLSTAWDLSSGSYANVSFDLSAQGESPRALFIGSGGTKMYTAGTTNDTVYQYSIALPTEVIDLDTGNYFSDTLAANTTYSISNAGDVQSFQLEVTGGSVGYVIGSANYDSKSFSVASEETNPFGIAFKSDGTKMYISGNSGDDVGQYSLSTAWDVSTASFDSVTFALGTPGTLAPQGLFFKTDGTKMYVPFASIGDVREYDLSTAWDLSTASYNSVFLDMSSQMTGTGSIYIKSDGLTLFALDYVSDTIYKYTLTTAWDVSTGSYSSDSFSVNSQDNTPYGLWFNDDGTKFIVAGDQNDSAYEYTMTTAWDITTASYSGTSFNLASAGSTTAPTGITFKTDGTKMYSVMRGSDTVYQYSTTSVATLTWPSSIEWAGGVAPAAPANGETDLFTITTDDSGTTYTGVKTADNLS